MDIATVLTDILVVLAAAKIAAELAERLGIPAVVGEIVAGIVVGPSLLGLVGGSDDVLRTLGEVGVILLLLEVGMEMDLGELSRVGRTSVLVATVGVVAPMVLGIGAMQLIGSDGNTALFVGAALTATSVGITARVFGDLRALATTEARIVLGAAVADDVMGLVVLTVVVRLVTEGSVSALSVVGILAVAIGFLVVGGAVSLRIAGPLFNLIERVSRSAGTMVALALVFTLALARLADSARLAPIIGAFVAGIALNRSDQAPVIRRELAPVGHLFIPVFFLQIGIDAEISAFGRAEVLRDAGLLLVCAAVGKLISPLGAIGSPGDKLLIGLGMLPRGEVGLIFATLGLQTGVIGDDLYAALLLVVLVTTLGTPQLLKLRYTRMRSAARASAALGAGADVVAAEPPGGWLVVSGDEVGLAALPPANAALAVGLDAAVRVGRLRPSAELLDWLSMVSDGSVEWMPETYDRLLDVAERGNARSWRFLDTVGLLPWALPPLAEGIKQRQNGSHAMDPLEGYRFASLERLRMLDPGDPLAIEADRIEYPDRLLLALLLADALDVHPVPVGAAEQVAATLGLDAGARSEVTALVRDRELFWAAAHRTAGLGEAAVVALATHLATPEYARALYILTALRNADGERWELARLRELYELVQAVLADSSLTDRDGRDLVARHRAAAHDLAGPGPGPDGAFHDRIESAPRSYLLHLGPAAIARHVQLLHPLPDEATVRTQVTADGDTGCYWLDVAARDRHGLLAAVTGALADFHLSIGQAIVATWPDGAALESFYVCSDFVPDSAELERAVAAALDDELSSPALPETRITFEHQGSPWHTACEVEAADKPGLLHQLATAFAAAGVDVVSATIAGSDGRAHDSFLLDGPGGSRLSTADEAAIVAFVEGGVSIRHRWLRSPTYVVA